MDTLTPVSGSVGAEVAGKERTEAAAPLTSALARVSSTASNQEEVPHEHHGPEPQVGHASGGPLQGAGNTPPRWSRGRRAHATVWRTAGSSRARRLRAAPSWAARPATAGGSGAWRPGKQSRPGPASASGRTERRRPGERPSSAWRTGRYFCSACGEAFEVADDQAPSECPQGHEAEAQEASTV